MFTKIQIGENKGQNSHQFCYFVSLRSGIIPSIGTNMLHSHLELVAILSVFLSLCFHIKGVGL